MGLASFRPSRNGENERRIFKDSVVSKSMVRTRSWGERLNMVHAEAAPMPAVVTVALMFWPLSPFVHLLLLVLATQPCHPFPSSH